MKPQCLAVKVISCIDHVFADPVAVMTGATPPARRLLRFGQFEFDLGSGELHKQGRKVRLEGQPVQVLIKLLEHPGELVTRETLRNELWPADTFVNFEQSLNAAV